MPCKHAALAAIYAQQMTEMNEPWRLWEITLPDGRTYYPKYHFIWLDDHEYRQIPKTIRIGNYDVPEPMREKPDINNRYWTISPGENDDVTSFRWSDDRVDNNLLRLGLCHQTRENCIVHAKALFSFSEVG